MSVSLLLPQKEMSASFKRQQVPVGMFALWNSEKAFYDVAVKEKNHKGKGWSRLTMERIKQSIFFVLQTITMKRLILNLKMLSVSLVLITELLALWIFPLSCSHEKKILQMYFKDMLRYMKTCSLKYSGSFQWRAEQEGSLSFGKTNVLNFTVLHSVVSKNTICARV